MNRYAFVITLATLAAAGQAFADDVTVDTTAFTSTATRAEVRAEYIRSRAEVAALTGEDSGSAYLQRRQAAQRAAATLAGQPSNAQ